MPRGVWNKWEQRFPEKRKEWKDKNRARIRANQKKYAAKAKDKIRKYQENYQTKKYMGLKVKDKLPEGYVESKKLLRKLRKVIEVKNETRHTI